METEVIQHLRLPPAVRNIILIWLAWFIVLFAYQALVPNRLLLYRPDYVLGWTPNETAAGAQRDNLYLMDPFMNAQVSWDSEYYLSIATVGYDDPQVRVMQARPSTPPTGVANRPAGGPPSSRTTGKAPSLNYAFFPFYPYAARVVAAPLRLFGLTPIATSTLAAVIVSLLGTLAAMLALYDLTRDELADAGGLRAAFYLVIFPSGFFLAQVYTEGLFVGLAFSALALLRRKHLLLAGLLAAFATWTRAAGGLLVVPLALAWLGMARADGLKFNRKLILSAVGVLLPIAAYLLWNAVLGTQFRAVEDGFFGRGLLLLERSWRMWTQTLQSLNQNPPPTSVYYLLELGGMALALVACLVTLRRYPGVALFGLGVLALSVSSGIPQSMIRYILTVPSLYIFLARLGRSTAFDRGWTTVSLLLMGLLATLFTFDMWVA